MKRGFSLIEAMIVIAVIAVMAAIAVPNLQRLRDEKAKQAKAETEAEAAKPEFKPGEAVILIDTDQKVRILETITSEKGSPMYRVRPMIPRDTWGKPTTDVIPATVDVYGSELVRTELGRLRKAHDRR